MLVLAGGVPLLLWLWERISRQQGAAGAREGLRAGVEQAGRRAEEAFKTPAPPAGEQWRVRARSLSAHSVAVPWSCLSPLEPEQILLSEVTTKSPEQVGDGIA